MASLFYTRRRVGACCVWDVKGKSHELHMSEPKRNVWKILLNLAKTRWRPQVLEPAMAVKYRIRVAKGRFLISSSIRKFDLRDTNVTYFSFSRREDIPAVPWCEIGDRIWRFQRRRFRGTFVYWFSFLYILNIFSLKSSKNRDIKPGREKHSYKKECTSEIRSI